MRAMLMERIVLSNKVEKKAGPITKAGRGVVRCGWRGGPKDGGVLPNPLSSGELVVPHLAASRPHQRFPEQN